MDSVFLGYFDFLTLAVFTIYVYVCKNADAQFMQFNQI